MKKLYSLLFTIVVSMSTVFASIGGKDNPFELVSGDNPIDFGTASSVFFTFTPSVDQLIILNLTNCQFYGNITTEGDMLNDSFKGKSYIQTKANNTYLFEVLKGWGTENPNMAVELHPTPYPDGISWETAIKPTSYMSFVSTGSYVPGYMTYTATENGVLQFTFSALATVTYSTHQFTPEESSSMNKMNTTYITGGGYRGHIEVTANETYWFKLEGHSTMLCSAELIHPEIGNTPDFPFTVNAGDNIRFPKEAGKYFYSITNDGNSGYLIFEGNEVFEGTANAGSSFDYPQQTSSGNINIRLSVSSSYKAYCLTLERTVEATEDQTFKAFYSNEPYDVFPGLEIESDVTINTQKYPGLYYYRITIPQDEHNIITVKPETEPTDASTEVSLYYSDNVYSPLAKGKEILYEAVQGREYTIGWRVAEKDAPLSFKVTFNAPPAGDSPNNPLPTALGENKIPAGNVKYFKYTATQDCKLSITPASDSGLGAPAVSMLPIPEDPYTQACEVTEENGAYLVSAQKNRGYLIIFKDIVTETSFTIAEKSNSQGESPSDPFIIEDIETALPQETGVYWFKYTVPRTGKLEISTTLSYEMAPNHQDYTYVYFYNPEDLHNKAGELRPDLDQNAFFKRVLNKVSGDVLYFSIRIVTPQPEKTLTLQPRDPVTGEVPELAIPIPFNGGNYQFTFPDIVNHEEEGIWYSIPLTPGKLSIEAITPGKFTLSLFAPDNTIEALIESTSLDYYYDEKEGMYFYTYGFREFELNKSGNYYIFLSDCEMPFTASIALSNETGITLPIQTDEKMTISTKPGSIEITNAEETIQITRFDGTNIATVQANEKCLIPVATGLYIVFANNKSYKVFVR